MRYEREPQPLLVIITGVPGSGKSTLARELGHADYLGLPVLSRDAIKAAMVETRAFAEPQAPRVELETDAVRAMIVPRSFDLFYDTLRLWLEAGVSVIAEHAFARRSKDDLLPLTQLARTALVHCVCPNDRARRRFLEREQHEGRIRPDRLALTRQEIAAGTDAWTRFEPMVLPVATLAVDTGDGYLPGLNEIAAFCRRAAVER